MSRAQLGRYKFMSQYNYTYCVMKFDQSFRTSMSSQNNELRSANKFHKLPWSPPASSWLSCHQLCDQTTASVCRSQAGLISGTGRGRDRSLETEPSPASLSLSSQSWTALAGQRWPHWHWQWPASGDTRGWCLASVTDVLCLQCKHCVQS